MKVGPDIVNDDTLAYSINLGSERSMNTRSDTQKKRNHGNSEWYCMVSCTVTYATALPKTTIYKVDTSNVITTEVSQMTNPSRGTFSATAGCKYFADKPVHFIDGGANERFVPLSLAGRYFGNISSRYSTSNYRFYNVTSTNATLSVYDNVTGGTDGTATSTITVNAFSSATYDSTTESAYVIFSSTQDLIASVAESGGGDKMILPPASTQGVYRRSNHYERTIKNAAPSTVGTYYINDSDPCFSVAIADGSGGDAVQGCGLEFLSDTYVFGQVLSDYHIVSPYSNKIRVQYWDTTRGGWFNAERHVLSGTLTSPAVVFREGNTGFGSDGNISYDSGGAANLAGGANLWRFRGTNPFLLTINDDSNDEEILCGFMWEDRRGNAVRNLGNKNYKRAVFNSRKKFTKNNRTLSFDGSDTFMELDSSLANLTSGTIEVVFKTSVNHRGALLGWGNLGTTQWGTFEIGPNTSTYSDEYISYVNVGGTDLQMYGRDSSAGSYKLNDGNYHHIVAVVDGSDNRIFVDGVDIGVTFKTGASNTSAFMAATTTNVRSGNSTYNGGHIPFDGEIAKLQIYSTGLTDDQIRKNFNAIRRRYNIPNI